MGVLRQAHRLAGHRISEQAPASCLQAGRCLPAPLDWPRRPARPSPCGSQGTQRCTGGCEQLFGAGRRCYTCHANELRNMRHHTRVSYALDMGNAM